MRANPKAARELAHLARNFNHPMMPKKAKTVIEVSAEFLVDLVDRVEFLEQEIERCREQTTTASR